MAQRLASIAWRIRNQPQWPVRRNLLIRPFFPRRHFSAISRQKGIPISVRIMSAVWEYAPYEGGTLLVLLALADYCNDEGGECWPNVASIAAKARLGVRQVNNILAQLKQEAAIISRRGGGRGVSSRYRVDVERLKSVSVKSNSVNPVSVKSATETLQSSSQNPEICDSAIRKNRKEPSLEPSVFEPDPRHAVIRGLIRFSHVEIFSRPAVRRRQSDFRFRRTDRTAT